MRGDPGGQEADEIPRRWFLWVVIGYSAFLALLVPVFLRIGRTGWFQFDDWDYLVNRKAGNLDDLLRPHNGHWETIPVLVYRGLFSVFGLRYLPFQFVSIVASFATAALLLVVMLRSRTRPWIAVLAATVFVFFGDAQYNVALRVTSITFIGFAVPLGLAQLILADHKGRLGRRDVIGVAVGCIALLCSNVATVMIFAVGLAMLVKRGWRIALFHTALPFAIFSVWYLTKGRHDAAGGNPGQVRFNGRSARFAWGILTGTFESLTRSHGIGGLLLLAFVAGLAVVLWRADAARRRDAIVPCALLAAGALSAIETAAGRANLLPEGQAFVRQGHYMAVVAVLMLPAVAFLAEETVRRWRVLTPVLIAVTLVAIGTNSLALYHHEHGAAKATTTFRDTVLAIPRLPLARVVPPETRPFLGTASPMTVQWLLDMVREGRIPKSRAKLATNAMATLRISLVIRATPPSACRPFDKAVTITLPRDGEFHFRARDVAVSYLADGKAVATISPTNTARTTEASLVNQGEPLALRIRPARSNPPPLVCN